MTAPLHFDQKGQYSNTQTNIDHADQVIIQPSTPALPVPQQLPSSPKDFTGREDEISGLLDQFGRGATITGLRGMGGVGKTALALVLADRLKDHFPDGQLFLKMQGTSKNPLKPEEAMAHIIHSYLGLDVKLPTDQNGLSGLYRSVLSEKKALILLDNAADRAQVELLVPPAGSALLITSRNKFALAGLKELDLNVLPRDDAKDLLLSICERIGERAGELAELCGCLPLALRNAAYALKERPNMGVASYIKRLADARKRLELVEASFTLSYQLLTQEMQRLWSLLSVFPADFDLAGAASVWEMENDVAEEALGELVKWSLVDFLPSAAGEGGRFKLHDLARDFAGSRLEDASREFAKLRHAKYYQNLLWTANNLFRHGNESISFGLKLFDINWMNIKSGQNWASYNRFKSDEIAKICSNYANAGGILSLRIYPHENIIWLEAALASALQIQSRMDEEIHLGNLGNTYLNLDDTIKAIDYYEQALKISREIKDKMGEGAYLGGLGLAYFDLDEPVKAIEYYNQALKISRKIGNRWGEGADLGNLGSVYDHLGKSRESIGYYDQALKISREIGDRRGEGNYLGNLGIAYSHLGEFGKAIESYNQALKIVLEMGDRRSEGSHLGNLGLAHYHQDESRKAIEYYNQALKISREIGDRRGEGIDLGNLGLAYYYLGEPRKAIEYYEQALKISQEINDRKGEGNHLSCLGLACSHRGEFDKSKEYYNQALKIAREIKYRRGEGDCLSSLGLVHCYLGEPEKAIEYIDEALKVAREIEDRKGEGKRLGNLGLVCSHMNEPHRSIDYYEQALKIARETRDRKDEGNWLGNLGSSYFDLGEPHKAIEYYEQALKIAHDIGDRRAEGNHLFNMSISLYNLGHRDRAISLAESALAIFEEIESPHAETVRKALAEWKS